MRRKGKLNFEGGIDRVAAKMAMFGFSAKCIARTCGFKSTSLVYYRNKATNIKLQDFREGRSPMSVLVMKRLAAESGLILDNHLDRASGPIRVPGIRQELPAYVRTHMMEEME